MEEHLITVQVNKADLDFFAAEVEKWRKELDCADELWKNWRYGAGKPSDVANAMDLADSSERAARDLALRIANQALVAIGCRPFPGTKEIALRDLQTIRRNERERGRKRGSVELEA